MRLALGALLLLLALALGFLAWLGAFSRVALGERTIGPYVFAYREIADATPSDVGRVTAEVYAEVSAAGGVELRPLGIYALDGSAQIGVAVGTSREKLAALRGVKLRDLPAQRGLVAEFPWRMPLSYLVSYLRVNPAFERAREERGWEIAPAWVLLDGATIVNMMPVIERPTTANESQ